MNEPEDANRIERFEQAWRRSVEGPARVTAAEAVGRAIAIARRRRRRRASALALATAAGLAAVALSVWRAPGLRPAATRPASPVAPAAGAVVATGAEVIVMWLDEDTPLYMTLDAGAGAGGPR